MSILNRNQSEKTERRIIIRKQVTKTKDYTEHDAEIRYPDGETETVTFDGMNENDGVIILYNYTDYRPGEYHGFAGRSSGGFMREKFMTLNDYSKFHTVERRPEQMEYTEYQEDRHVINEAEWDGADCFYCSKHFNSLDAFEDHVTDCDERHELNEE